MVVNLKPFRLPLAMSYVSKHGLNLNLSAALRSNVFE